MTMFCASLLVFSGFCLVINGQSSYPLASKTPVVPKYSLNDSIGNFSLEILYLTSKAQSNENLIISPVTVWTTLAMIAEGATEETYVQIKNATRLPKNLNRLHNSFQSILKQLLVNTSTIQLDQVNSLFVDKTVSLERDYQQQISAFYKAQLISVNFAESHKTAELINKFVEQVTRGRIKNLVDENAIADAVMLLASGIYFKGQWTAPFNESSTEKRPFYNSNDRSIGEVNMMYNRYTYPFANIKEIQARVIELPYGVEGRLSMLIMLPNHNVTLEDMFLNFKDSGLTFDKMFKDLRLIQEEFGDDEVDCFIPRFKIESNLQLNSILKTLGINDMFDPRYARLTGIARNPLYVSKVIHKAEIEVSEQGTTASAITAAEFANRIGVIRFEANRPFAYMIVEKTTNTIVFGGIYQKPSLF